MRRVLALAAVLALASACGGEAEGDAPFEVPGPAEQTTEVNLPPSYRFEPAAIEVAVGETVTWTNQDNFPHNVHLLDGSDTTLDLPIGESASHTFSEPGTVYYECSLHPQDMRGRIEVR